MPPPRIVFLGDSITDGHTYPLLVEQALLRAQGLAPRCTNAGIASDTSAMMHKRLARDVLVHQPATVTLSAGINDLHRQVTFPEYRQNITAIADELAEHGVALVLMTTTLMGPKHAALLPLQRQFNEFLEQLAQERNLALAPVHQLMAADPAGHQALLEKDQLHVSFAGDRLMAKAILMALGKGAAPVPAALELSIMPGVVRDWRIAVREKGSAPLTAAQAAAITPDQTWKPYSLPDPRPRGHWWEEQERQRGFAQGLDLLAGQGESFLGYAGIDADQARSACINTGAHLQAVFLNGEEVFRSSGWTGWHAGKERITVKLRAGSNHLLIETGAAFFLSITPGNDW